MARKKLQKRLSDDYVERKSACGFSAGILAARENRKISLGKRFDNNIVKKKSSSLSGEPGMENERLGIRTGKRFAHIAAK